MDDLTANKIGMRGEVAAAEYFGVEADYRIGHYSHDPDLTTKGGIRVDVKTSSRVGGDLLVTPTKSASTVDVYLYVTDRSPEFEMTRWVWSHDYFRLAATKTFGRKPTLALEQSRMEPMDTFPPHPLATHPEGR